MSGGCSGECPCGAGVGRRDFLTHGALGTIGALLATACGDRVIGGTFPTDPLPTQPITIRPSKIPELAAVGGIVKVDGNNGMPVAIVRTGESSFDALSLVCPHQGAIVEITGSPSFRCPSHLAEFAADGTWIGGKQTGDLTRMGVTYDPRTDLLIVDGIADAVPPPIMAVSPASEAFSAAQGGAPPAPQTIAITNSGGGTLTGLGIVVAYAAGQANGWLAATLDTTTAPATITLQPAVAGLAAGTYAATVQITAPNATNAPQAVSVSVVVTAAPVQKPAAIGLASSTASFTGVAGGANPPTQQLAIANAGGGTLAGLSVGAIAYGAGGGAQRWLVATLTSSAAPATLVLAPSIGALAAGTYTATVPVIASGASNSPQQVTVTLVVSSAAAPPQLALSAGTLAFSATQGGTAAAQTITVQNSGGGSLGGLAVGAIAYGAGASGWLGAALSSTTAPAVLTVTPSAASLAPGTYSATVPITAAGVNGSPQNLAVTITVTAAAGLSVTPSSASLNATVGSSPGGLNVNVAATSGAVTGLSYTVAYGAGASGWLSGSSFSATSTPAVLTLRAASSTLAAGTYTATVQVNGSGVSPQTIAVTLTVAPGGLPVVIANWPALGAVGGIAGSVGTVQGTPTAVVRTGANSFAAFSMRCPHQGTTIRIENWHSTGSAFHCPNHDALFDASGALLPSSPQKTSNLVARTVTYTPGSSTLYIT
ncbi:MAG TPA: Rieske 2Fe-2S domain-containing protein [Gemmatimonadaceae bacterium]|nr:Rieske 2Fe-2S domain-containing protein [Gemmatimonadaceae bacterium]